jgi:hypothetical protein
MIDTPNISDRKLAQIYVALAMMRKVAEEETNQTETIRSVLSLVEVASNILEDVLVTSPLDLPQGDLVQSEVELLM